MAAITVQRPSPESETRPANFARSGTIEERDSGQIQQPRRDDAAAAPDLGDIGQVEVVRVVLGVAERRGFGVDGASLRADVGVAKDVQPFGVGGHDAVLDAVVDHLDEMPCAAWAAVQVAVFGGAARSFPDRACAAPRRYWEPERRTQDRDAERRLPRRRSSDSSLAPLPRRRRWFRRRRSGCPSASARRRGECHRGSRSCRRR